MTETRDGVATLWVGTSWKMNKSLGEARRYARELDHYLRRTELAGVQPFIIPSFTAVSATREALGEDTPVLLGVQNAHWDDHGAWTGEVSVAQAKDAGAQLVEIGHSERREHFGETVATTRLKVAAALAHGLVPLLCIGESDEVRRAGESSRFILDQAAGALDGLTPEQMKRVLIAYEPVWAIGTGKTSTPKDADDTHRFIRDMVGRLYSRKAAEDTVIQYGGSVKPNNAKELMSMENIDGLLVGGASLAADSFVPIVRYDAGG